MQCFYHEWVCFGSLRNHFDKRYIVYMLMISIAQRLLIKWQQLISRSASDLLLLALLSCLIISGVVLSVNSNYGGDNDTYAMLSTFSNLTNGYGYSPSRFTGYPVAEIGIGFIAFYFGSWLNNLVSFMFFVISLILIYKSFVKGNFDSRFIIFLILCVSNPVLFFDNIAPMDYAWALVFFSLGLFFLNKQDFVFSILFFGISIGTRPNYLIFCLVAILFFKHERPVSKHLKFSMALVTTFIGGLFYLPIWFNSGFGLDWLTAVRPINQGYLYLVARFIGKTWMAFGLLALPFSMYLLLKSMNKLHELRNLKLVTLLILSNLLIYLSIPVERSYLQLSLILFTLLLTLSPLRHLVFLALLNVVSWFVLINPLSFTFRSDKLCDPIEVVAARFEPSIGKGELYIFLEGQNKSICYQDFVKDKKNELNSGSKLN